MPKSIIKADTLQLGKFNGRSGGIEKFSRARYQRDGAIDKKSPRSRLGCQHRDPTCAYKHNATIRHEPSSIPEYITRILKCRQNTYRVLDCPYLCTGGGGSRRCGCSGGYLRVRYASGTRRCCLGRLTLVVI
ncbi:unnamed protein product [Rhizoctonia solani]|uniref:Uncharacterized protein n=1 Tax=Rhizoctonia solani TaxID=456999 RepID=A0A8H3GZI7_9AGAM|nr:unnamed protein product [Rhizoctonia solani]